MPRRCTRCQRPADDSPKAWCRYCGGALEEGLGREIVVPPPIPLEAVAVPAMAGPVLTTPASNEKAGLGGWLILPIIGFLLTPLRLLHGTFTELIPFLGTPELEAIAEIKPMFPAVVLMEILANLALAVFAVVVLVNLLGKKHRAPGLAITFYTVIFGVVVVDLGAAWMILGELVESAYWKAALKDVVRALLTLAIWGSYFNSSRRVKATFVNE